MADRVQRDAQGVIIFLFFQKQKTFLVQGRWASFPRITFSTTELYGHVFFVNFFVESLSRFTCCIRASDVLYSRIAFNIATCCRCLGNIPALHNTQKTVITGCTDRRIEVLSRTLLLSAILFAILKVVPGGRVTLPVKFSCKPGLG